MAEGGAAKVLPCKPPADRCTAKSATMHGSATATTQLSGHVRPTQAVQAVGMLSVPSGTECHGCPKVLTLCTSSLIKQAWLPRVLAAT